MSNPTVIVILREFVPYREFGEGFLVQLSPRGDALTDSGSVATFADVPPGRYVLNCPGKFQNASLLDGTGLQSLRIIVPSIEDAEAQGLTIFGEASLNAFDLIDPVENFDRGGSPEGRINGSLGKRYYDSRNSREYVKTTDGGNTGWR
jgi:hypothetical protein